jgi:cyclophilin family peptidyl-prolyl cis-trans isomerase
MITSDQKYIGLLAQNVEKIYANCVHNQTRIIPNIMIWVSIILTQDLHYKYPTKKIYKVCTLDPRQKIKFKAYHPKIELKNEQGQIITAYAIYKQSNKQFYIELGNTAINPGKYLLLGEEVDDSRSIDVSNVYTVREAYTKMMEQRQLQTKKQITRLTERLFTFQQLLEKQNEIIRLCAAKKNIEVN